ncbi:uncharacterized mitochondrial protein-like protein, partial [Tanacetum coccineum]
EPINSTSTNTTPSSPPSNTPSSPPTTPENTTPNNDTTQSTTAESTTAPENHQYNTADSTHATPFTQPDNTSPSPSTSPPNTPLPPSLLPLKKSQRTKIVPTKLKDFHHKHPPSTNFTITKHQTTHFFNYNNIHNQTTLHFINTLTHDIDATSYTQASKNPKLVEAMNYEISILESNHTWELITLPHNKHAIGYSSLFTYYKDRDALVHLIYVDNIMLAGNNSSMISNIKQQLHQTFGIKDLGHLHYYLGIEFLRNSKGLAMTHRKYALDLIEFACLQNEKPSKTPLDPRIKLDYIDGEPLLDPSHFRTLVGKLIYLTINRLDIAFAAQLLSQFSQNPHTSHLQALVFS